MRVLADSLRIQEEMTRDFLARYGARDREGD
jgi:hypothetical protein